MTSDNIKDYELTLTQALELMEEGEEVELVSPPLTARFKQEEQSENRSVVATTWVGQVSERNAPVPRAS